MKNLLVVALMVVGSSMVLADEAKAPAPAGAPAAKAEMKVAATGKTRKEAKAACKGKKGHDHKECMKSEMGK